MVTAEKLTNVLKKLLEDSQFQQLQSERPASSRPQSIVAFLRDKNWITPWQGETLLAGRGEELILNETYVLDGLLGQGGMGRVYRARHRHLRSPRAIKVIRPDVLLTDVMISRFYREMEMAARLKHPNIIQAHDAGKAGDRHYLVMEYVEGRDLHSLVTQMPQLPTRQAADYVRQASLGLQHVHEHDLVHRDIKPSNLLLSSKDERISILDLGVARLLDPEDKESQDSITPTGIPMGTPDYMAPEQAENSKTVDIRADVYSLGCTLYRLLAGRVPFPSESGVKTLMRHLMDAPDPVNKFRSDIPEQILSILSRMMEKKPENRPWPKEVADVLKPFCQKKGSATSSEVPHAPPKPGAGPDESTDMESTLEIHLPDFPTAATPETPPENLPQASGMEFVRVPAGSFWMSEDGKNAQKQVEMPNDFYVSIYPITQSQWQAVTGTNPSRFSRFGEGRAKVQSISDADLQMFPVEQISWDDVQEFLQKLNEQEKDSPWFYRLPTDQEWERACRGTAESKEDCSFRFYFQEPTNDLSSDLANANGKYPCGNAPKGLDLGRTTKVGSYPPNSLGIYDMHGNVWEWCLDWEQEGEYRVTRGGSWFDGCNLCRAGYRNGSRPTSKSAYLGARLVADFLE